MFLVLHTSFSMDFVIVFFILSEQITALWSDMKGPGDVVFTVMELSISLSTKSSLFPALCVSNCTCW